MTSKIDQVIKELKKAENLARDTQINLPIGDLMWVCTEAIRVLRSDPILLPIKAPITVCGDIHGQYYDLLDFMKKGGDLPNTNYLFLGDYVDRGKNSIETFTYLLALKIKYPNNIWLLRGNHETREISKLYGFFNECTTRYNQDLWIRFTDVFMWLPMAAIISQRIFCVHGGLSPELNDLTQISKIARPLAIPEHGLLSDLLWSDPVVENVNWTKSDRGTSFTYGEGVVDDFLCKNDFDLLCRGHQVVETGYQFPFYPNQSVLTVFSAPDYCQEYGNKGAMLHVDESLKCTFTIMEPPPRPDGKMEKKEIPKKNFS